MPNTLLNATPVIPINRFPFDPEFISDVVDISVFDCYINASEYDLKAWKKRYKSDTTFDFTKCDNLNIRQEYKFFIQEKSKQGITLGTLMDFKRNHNILFDYINIKGSHLDSIIDLDFDEYKFYFKQQGFNEKSTAGKKLLSNMTMVTRYITHPKLLVAQKLINFITEYNQKDIPELEKDIWDTRKLPFNVITNDTHIVKNISFFGIPQPLIRKTVKDYTEFRLHSKSLTTVYSDVCSIAAICVFLNEHYPNVNSLADINRNMIEHYITHLRTSNTTENTIASHFSSLKTFFETIILLELPNIPTKALILKDDYKASYEEEPRVFTDNEMKKIFAHIDCLEQQIARMVYIHSHIGTRISELCLLKPCDITKRDNDTYFISVYQNKTDTPNELPIQELCYKILMKAYQVSCKKFGEDTKYVFAQSKNKPIQPRKYIDALNKMSYENKLTFDDGTPLHIESHAFRATLSTKLANLGLDLDVVNKMLGHSSATSIKSYVRATNKTLRKHIKTTTDFHDLLISNINNPATLKIKENNESYVALDNGYCSKSGSICESANACLSCSMFVPSAEHLIQYKIQLRTVENNIAICKKNEFTKELEYNMEQKRLLERIIAHLEKKS